MRLTGVCVVPRKPLIPPRPLPQALSDLIFKYDSLAFNHPERLELARMISCLEAEIALRVKGKTASGAADEACIERQFFR